MNAKYILEHILAALPHKSFAVADGIAVADIEAIEAAIGSNNLDYQRQVIRASIPLLDIVWAGYGGCPPALRELIDSV